MQTESDRDRNNPDPPSEKSLSSLVEAMNAPAFYPRRPSRVTHLETHISHVFLAGDFVYKIKKPVRFSFLDFSTLEKRKYFLHEELRLNRRLAHSVYLDVLPLTHDRGGWRLDGDSEPLEYALVMRRLPANRMLPFLLERGQITQSMMESVADVVANFHSQAPTGDGISHRGAPEIVRGTWDENISDTSPFIGKYLDPGALERLKQFGVAFLAQARELLTRRARDGRIREVHGDLHCEHICFAHEGIQIFDCIEFSRELRCVDVASEVAFLMMDLGLHGADELGKHFLRRYLEIAQDPDLPRLLPFYKCYRAMVRGKVEGLQAKDSSSPKAQAYFDLAYRVIWEPFKSILVVVSGLSGTGKSTLARRLSQRLGIPVISSDVTRKTIAKVSGPQSAGYAEAIYSPAMSEKTYAEMMEQGEGMMQARMGVILDATFQRKAHRDLARQLASKFRVPLAWIFCKASEDVIQTRLQKRTEEGGDPSDAGWDIYLRQKAAFEEIDEVPGKSCLILDTGLSLKNQIEKVEEFLWELYSGKT